MSAWSERFLSRLPENVRAVAKPVPDLEGLLDRGVEAGAAAWPQLALPPDAFLDHVADCVATLGEDEIGAAIANLRAADLYLACAVVRGDERALAAFEQAHFAAIDFACRSRADLPITRDDVAQLVRERLLVAAPGKRPRIVEYAGRGSLRGWFRTAVVRLVSGEAARPRHEVGVEADALAAFPSLLADPELEYMKRLYKREFEASLTDAIAALSAEDRDLLRQSLIEQLSIDQLAVVYGAHRTTLARRIAQARESLFKGLRTALTKRLSIDKQEFENILRLIRSRFDLTMERLFRAQS
jgi:RNA polymerase sigma-70 factor (ECF subfamily)